MILRMTIIVILSGAKNPVKQYFVYIATNHRKTVLYTGVTNNLERRIYEHKNKLIEGFSSKYNVDTLIWCEAFTTPHDAITAEKRIKGWTRVKKLELIRKTNPDWKDLELNMPGSFPFDKLRVRMTKGTI